MTTKRPDDLRPGDTVLMTDGTVVTVDEIPYLNANGHTAARVRYPNGDAAMAAWYARDAVPILGEVECCACRWIKDGTECGHGESDGITSPHVHCEKHR